MSKYLLINGVLDSENNDKTVHCQLRIGEDSDVTEEEYISEIQFSSKYTTKMFQLDYELESQQVKF